VTGTRGKSTVARLIAAGLRESGRPVLAKTTGSRPVIILPDGKEEEIARTGLPSVLEEKRILRRGANLGALALVTELMSIRPESAAVESRLLQPQLLIITNVRLDHRVEMGRTKPEVAGSLASAIPEDATVFLPEEEVRPEFLAAAVRVRSRIISVKRREPGEPERPGGISSLLYFEENLRLALAVSGHLGIPDDVALRGMARAEPDFGALKVWEAALGAPPRPWFLVSAFAANEPESTGLILARMKSLLPGREKRMLGILNFRQDRGDRTLQWLKAWEQGYFRDFARLYFTGVPVRALERKTRSNSLPVLTPLGARSPAAAMRQVVQAEDGEAVLVGMGNMGGLGAELVDYWAHLGKPYVP
jgi:poly-gamma-glutamate synthase PgsB/CapB